MYTFLLMKLCTQKPKPVPLRVNMVVQYSAEVLTAASFTKICVESLIAKTGAKNTEVLLAKVIGNTPLILPPFTLPRASLVQ
jgi:hypothetical protein